MGRVDRPVAGGEADGLVEGGGGPLVADPVVLGERVDHDHELAVPGEVGEGGGLVAGRRAAVADDGAARQLHDLEAEAEHLALQGDARRLHLGERIRGQQAAAEEGVEERGEVGRRRHEVAPER